MCQTSASIAFRSQFTCVGDYIFWTRLQSCPNASPSSQMCKGVNYGPPLAPQQMLGCSPPFPAHMRACTLTLSPCMHWSATVPVSVWHATLGTHACSGSCVQDKETFPTQILDVNQGGLICRCQSLQAFIPISQLNSKVRGRDNWLSIEVCVGQTFLPCCCAQLYSGAFAVLLHGQLCCCLL